MEYILYGSTRANVTQQKKIVVMNYGLDVSSLTYLYVSVSGPDIYYLFVCSPRALTHTMKNFVRVVCLYSFHTSTRMESIGIQIHWTFCSCIFVNNFHLSRSWLYVCACASVSLLFLLKDHIERCKQHTAVLHSAAQENLIGSAENAFRFSLLCALLCFRFYTLVCNICIPMPCAFDMARKYSHTYACEAY